MQSNSDDPLTSTSLFGKRLKERRIYLRLSQESLGVSIGLDESCSRARISRYESGLHEPKTATTQLLAKSLKVPMAYFYCNKDLIADLLLKINLMTDDQIKLISQYAHSILEFDLVSNENTSISEKHHAHQISPSKN